MLKKCNGGFHFRETYKGLSAEEIKKAQEKVGGEMVPFAADIDGNMLCVKKATGEVCDYDCDDGASTVQAPNLGLYLEVLRDGLLSGKTKYDEDMGLFETQ